HIFYDLLDNMVRSLKPSSSAVGASVVQGLSSACLSGHGFTFYSDLTSTAEDVSLENVNPVEALLGEGGLAEKYGGELTRDWFDVFLVRRVGVDSDVQIREGKNLIGISYDVDETDVVTRIMPTGEDADGNILYLPELYIDSPNLGAYTHPRWMHLAVAEAKEVAEGENYKSLTACHEAMRAAAQAEFDKGCDLPTVTLKVDFVNCVDTEEYRQYAFLQNIFLGDSVRVVARRIGVEVSLRMTQYTYDCLTQKYTAVTLGTAADTLEGSMISARQLASGSITDMKLALNSVGSGQLQSGCVGSLQIRNAAIGSAHIQDACITRAHIAEALIDTLSVNALTAVTAKIKELAAGSVTTDDLYASVAMIAAAQLTTANIVSADIQWADIEALTASIAQISKAQITAAVIDEANIDWAAITTLTAATAEIVKAQMQTADIDWSHIKDLATDTAIITQGTAGELYIARLAVTEANMVSLTVGELVVKGTDGHFYALSVDEGGQVVTTLKQIANDDVADQSIDGGEKIIEGTITAGTLNVQDIFADNAVIRSLIAANLDVDTLFAREATVAALNAMDITSNTYLKLMVSGKADKEDLDALGQRMTSAEQKITPQAITATVAASASFIHEKYEGRNYCLGSGGEFAFLSNRYYEDGKATSLTLKSLAVSDDFFAHSQNGASIRISLDIRRQGVDASEAATPGVYSGLWVYYLYSENGQFKTVGRGWYLRTTDASFEATDDGWVRLQYGPLDLSPYNPVSISYFALGTSAANGMTGIVRFRNVKLEVLDAWTDWSAAPEDIYGLAGRMDSAESRITQNASNIALKVSTSLYNTEKVYRSSTAPTTLYANMLWLDTSLSPPILKRYTGSAWVAVGAQELRTSGISIGANNVAITTENFLLQLLDPANNENVLMEMSASGDVGFQALYADEVVSPSVVNAYTGPATLYVYPALSGMAANACRSLREALSRINGKALRYDVTVTFFTSEAETLYEMEGVEISGVTGPHTLRIEGMDRNKTLSTFLTVSSCTARIELSYLNIRDCRGL
ncbi:MAG: phage tail protein, partial [Clostridiales bacterium]|nr:phage tail protein [Clostridiales bacterium]